MASPPTFQDMLRSQTMETLPEKMPEIRKRLDAYKVAYNKATNKTANAANRNLLAGLIWAHAYHEDLALVVTDLTDEQRQTLLVAFGIDTNLCQTNPRWPSVLTRHILFACEPGATPTKRAGIPPPSQANADGGTGSRRGVRRSLQQGLGSSAADGSAGPSFSLPPDPVDHDGEEAAPGGRVSKGVGDSLADDDSDQGGREDGLGKGSSSRRSRRSRRHGRRHRRRGYSSSSSSSSDSSGASDSAASDVRLVSGGSNAGPGTELSSKHGPSARSKRKHPDKPKPGDLPLAASDNPAHVLLVKQLCQREWLMSSILRRDIPARWLSEFFCSHPTMAITDYDKAVTKTNSVKASERFQQEDPLNTIFKHRLSIVYRPDPAGRPYVGQMHHG